MYFESPAMQLIRSFGHRVDMSPTRRFQTNMYILGIDVSNAFDTIDRHKLLLVLNSIWPGQRPDNIALLSNIASISTSAWTLINIRNLWYTQKWDALSPLLCIVYLEEVLWDPCHHLRISMRELNIIMSQWCEFHSQWSYASQRNKILLPSKFLGHAIWSSMWAKLWNDY